MKNLVLVVPAILLRTFPKTMQAAFYVSKDVLDTLPQYTTVELRSDNRPHERRPRRRILHGSQLKLNVFELLGEVTTRNHIVVIEGEGK